MDRPHDEEVIRGILRRLGHRETARVVNDAAIALVAGAPERVGIVVLAGTGSIAYGADRAGSTARSGGYGFLLADEGSGYWLGHQALRAAVRAADGRGPRALLAGLVFEALEVGSVAELVPRVYEKGLPKHRIAALAPLVQKAARRRATPWPPRSSSQAAHELALAARAVARQLVARRRALSGGAGGRRLQGLPLPGRRASSERLEPARAPSPRRSRWSPRAAPWPWPSTSCADPTVTAQAPHRQRRRPRPHGRHQPRASSRRTRSGIVTSATLMVNYAPRRARWRPSPRQHPRLGIGLHVALTGGPPACRPSSIPSLVDAQGRLPAQARRPGGREARPRCWPRRAPSSRRFREIMGRDSHPPRQPPPLAPRSPRCWRRC